MKKNNSVFYDLILRYAILLILGITGLSLFYFILSPLTISFVYFILDIFFNVSLSGNVLIFSGQLPVAIIGACVAGSAYYLLTILNLSTPNIKIKTRLVALAFSFVIFLIINSLRIVILSVLHILNSSFFDIIHLVFWYFFSVVFVVGIWFFEVKIFKIKNTPLYSDLKFLYKTSFRKN